MIANDEEMKVTQERIARFQDWLAKMRRKARPEGFQSKASGYRLEVARMRAEVMDCLLRPAVGRPSTGGPAHPAPAGPPVLGRPTAGRSRPGRTLGA